MGLDFGIWLVLVGFGCVFDLVLWALGMGFDTQGSGLDLRGFWAKGDFETKIQQANSELIQRIKSNDVSILDFFLSDDHLSKVREKCRATSEQRYKRICVFCGSNTGNKPEFMKAAKELGRVMAAKNMHLVYGGGNLGMMGTVSKAVQEGGGHVLGIIPRPLANEMLIGSTNIDERIVSGMSEQIREMINTADAFIALPGGLGTFEEIFTVASWVHLNIHRKPIGILNIEHFFDFLFVFLAEAKRHEFVTKSVEDIFLTATNAEELIDQILAFEPKLDPIISQLDWTDSDPSKKRRLDIDLNR